MSRRPHNSTTPAFWITTVGIVLALIWIVGIPTVKILFEGGFN